jgi:hypothetical protein
MKFETATSFFIASLAPIACNKNRVKSKPDIVISLAYYLGYNESELARLKPAPGGPAGSMWGFQSKHMEYIRTQQPKYF